MKQMGLALNSYGKAWDFIMKNGLWKFFFATLTVSVGLWVGGYYAIHWVSNEVADWIVNTVSGWFGMNGDGFIGAVVKWSLELLVAIAVWIMYLSVFKSIMLIIISPLLAYISERVDEIITGNHYPFDGDQMMRDVVRGVAISLRNLFLELGFTFVFFVISFIPVIGWAISLVGMFAVASYFYGFSMMDYTNERRRMTIRDSIRFIRNHRGIAIGNGMIFSLFFMIPFFGKFVAPVIAPLWSVVAATLAIHEMVNLKSGQQKYGT
ncbi:MAG: EI24 domain-containing protein [Bacteroidia bacterium]|nr:EI24 domain-containing protein [Bacteroidia bacterium]